MISDGGRRGTSGGDVGGGHRRRRRPQRELAQRPGSESPIVPQAAREQSAQLLPPVLFPIPILGVARDDGDGGPVQCLPTPVRQRPEPVRGGRRSATLLRQGHVDVVAVPNALWLALGLQTV